MCVRTCMRVYVSVRACVCLYVCVHVRANVSNSRTSARGVEIVSQNGDSLRAGSAGSGPSQPAAKQ